MARARGLMIAVLLGALASSTFSKTLPKVSDDVFQSTAALRYQRQTPIGGGFGKGIRQLSHPSDLAALPDGDLCVADRCSIHRHC